MTTTMPAQKEVITTLTEMGLRDKYYIIVGGGPAGIGTAAPACR